MSTTSQIISEFENEVYDHAAIDIGEWIDYYHYLVNLAVKVKKVKKLYKTYMQKLLDKFQSNDPDRKGKIYITRNKNTLRVKKYELIKKMAMAYAVD
jgi:hypothetical protein